MSGLIVASCDGGVVRGSELEQVIERAMVDIDGRIGRDDLRALVERLGFVGQVAGDQVVH